MSKAQTTNNDALLNAMRRNVNCNYHHDQVDTTPMPEKPRRKPSLDYYDNVGRGHMRKALTMAVHGRY